MSDTKSIHKEILFYEEDIVKLMKKKKKKDFYDNLALIRKVGGQLDSDFSSTDEEDVIDDERMKIQLIKNNEIINAPKKRVKLIDRALIYGHVVKLAEIFPEGQNGIVVESKSLLHLKIGDMIVKNVDSKDEIIKPIHEFQGEGAVCVYNDVYVCKIKSIEFDLKILFKKDNSSCVLKGVNHNDFFNEKEIERLFDDHYPFYPGMAVKFKNKTNYLKENVEWLNGGFYQRKIHQKGEIIEVTPSKVEMRFLMGKLGENNLEELNNTKIDMNKIKFFNHFNYSKYSIGDVVYYDGKIAKIIYAQTSCDVRWQNGILEKNISSKKLYPRSDVGDNDFFVGDIVMNDDKLVLVKKVNDKEKIATIKYLKDDQEEMDISCYELKDTENYDFGLADYVLKFDDKKNWIGQIIDKKDESLFVQWLDDKMTWIKYDEVVLVGNIVDFDDDSDSDSDSNESDSDYSDSDEEEGEEDEILNEVIKHSQKIDPVTIDISKNMVDSKHFNIVDDLDDHKYVLKTTSFSSSYIKIVQKEWKFLKKHLEGTNIFVIVSKNRIDLLRAVIIGSKGTPYFNSVFIFDIYFPSLYNTSPPICYFESQGYLINPNLYEDGEICLSLINTWRGNDEAKESWQSGESNIFQVLLSFQSLVLNKNPFFNEAGYNKISKTIQGESDSKQFNEKCLVSVLKHQIKTIDNIKCGCKDIVINHFKTNVNIIQKCLSLLVENNLDVEVYNIQDKPSKGFVQSIKRIMLILKKKIEALVK